MLKHDGPAMASFFVVGSATIAGKGLSQQVADDLPVEAWRKIRGRDANGFYPLGAAEGLDMRTVGKVELWSPIGWDGGELYDGRLDVGRALGDVALANTTASNSKSFWRLWLLK